MALATQENSSDSHPNATLIMGCQGDSMLLLLSLGYCRTKDFEGLFEQIIEMKSYDFVLPLEGPNTQEEFFIQSGLGRSVPFQ